MRSQRMGSCCEDCYPVQPSHARKIGGDTLSILSMRDCARKLHRCAQARSKLLRFGLVR